MLDSELGALCDRIVSCGACPRLVRWREEVAERKVRRFADQEYWGKPIPGFGDPTARLLLVGLAPAAHGGNRTGRMFTGDESGNWLFRALYRAGFANQPESVDRNDGLRLKDCYITATLRCAPPQNRPARVEIRRCRSFLLEELSLLRNARIVVGLGRIGFDAALGAFRDLRRITYSRKPVFGHNVLYTLGRYSFIASYHPSQQNTYTRKLTRPMLDAVFMRAKRRLDRL